MAVTSEYSPANLGLLDSDAAGMLDPWCQRRYEQHFIGRGPSGEYVLTASCRQPKSRKSILMAIRTAFSNSGHPLSSLRGDGVELWTDAQFEKVPAPELNDNYEELLELWLLCRPNRTGLRASSRNTAAQARFASAQRVIF